MLREAIKPTDWGVQDEYGSHFSRDSRLFESLADEWEQQTSGMPRIKDRLSHPAYLQIIAWGQDAIPHLLRRLDCDNPDHWFNALSEITGENPVPSNSRGQIKKMAEAWVIWGRLKGWI